VYRLRGSNPRPIERSKKLIAEGVFEKRKLDWTTTCILPAAIGIGILLTYVFQLPWIGMLVLVVAHLRAFCWIHDVAHHAIFADELQAYPMVDLLSIVLFGSLGATLARSQFGSCKQLEKFREHQSWYTITHKTSTTTPGWI